jgi:hypothetical protein
MEYINVQNTLHHACNERVYMRVDVYESWEARVCIRISSTLMLRSNANKSCMRVDWILPHVQRKLSSQFEPVQSRVGGQTRARVAWELTEYYRVRSENSHHNLNQFKVELAVKREQELHESWLNITACVAKLSSQFEPVQSRVGGHMRARVAWELTEYYRVRSENSHHNLNQFKVELAVTCERELKLSSTLILVWLHEAL